MNSFIGLILSLTACIFLLFGSLIVFKTKNNDKVVTFSVSIGLIVLILLVIFHLLPECIETLSSEFNDIQSYAYIFLMILIGMSFLKILDYFVPEHHHHEKNGKDCVNNLEHIAKVTCIALLLHNFVEGMALYTTTISSIKSGVLLALGIGLHNVPLGLTITSSFYKENGNVKKTLFYVILLGLSTFVGAVGISLFKNLNSNMLLTGTIFGITIGMILYIVCFELWHHFKHSENSKIKTLGLLVGGLLMLITTIL